MIVVRRWPLNGAGLRVMLNSVPTRGVGWASRLPPRQLVLVCPRWSSTTVQLSRSRSDRRLGLAVVAAAAAASVVMDDAAQCSNDPFEPVLLLCGCVACVCIPPVIACSWLYSFLNPPNTPNIALTANEVVEKGEWAEATWTTGSGSNVHRHLYAKLGDKTTGGFWNPHTANGSWVVLVHGSARDANARAVAAEWADTETHGRVRQRDYINGTGGWWYEMPRQTLDRHTKNSNNLVDTRKTETKLVCPYRSGNYTWSGPEYIFKRLGPGQNIPQCDGGYACTLGHTLSCPDHPKNDFAIDDHAPRVTVTKGPGNEVCGRIQFETDGLEEGQTYHFCWVRRHVCAPPISLSHSLSFRCL